MYVLQNALRVDGSKHAVRDAALVATVALLALCAAGCQDDGERKPAARNTPRETALPGDTRPNLLVITLDTARADHLGCYGAAAARTPH
ncbi:hypothetical protein KKG45_10690, partial [bacterium]|nr:hypothetical protein [bacterium]